MFAARMVDSATGSPLNLAVSPAAPDGSAPLALGDPGRRLKKSMDQGTLPPGAATFYSTKADPQSVTARAIVGARRSSVPRKGRPGNADATGAFVATPESIAATMVKLSTMRVEGALDVEEDIPFLREFQRITQQIHEDLAYPARIAHHIRRRIGRKAQDQLDPFLEGGRGKQLRDMLADLAEVERTLLQIQLAGFNF